MAKSTKPYILGLDLGVQSVGWAMIDVDEGGNPCGIRRSGVRCFDSGVGSETEIASGKDESQNIKRRQMRQQRRQLWRRGRRLKKIFLLLQKAGLLPPGETRTPQQRHELLKRLDAELSKTYLPANDRVAGHLLPYRLRALALDQPLPPFAFGRALFHLAQRRGFLSNRKSAAKDDEDSGDVKAGHRRPLEEDERDRSSNARRILLETRSGRSAYPQTLDRAANVSRRVRGDLGSPIATSSGVDGSVERADSRRHLSSTALEVAEGTDRHVRVGARLPSSRRAHRSKLSDSDTCKRSTTWKS